MKTAFIQTGKTSDRNILAAVEEYASRIRKYAGFEIITVADLKNTRNMPPAEQKIREGRKIVQLLTPEDYVILLDERGKELRTTAFADLLSGLFMLPKKRIVFVTGGAWGFSDEVYERGDARMSLSKMTFPHQLVRLLFVEQLYRAFTIIRGEPYHHE